MIRLTCTRCGRDINTTRNEVTIIGWELIETRCGGCGTLRHRQPAHSIALLARTGVPIRWEPPNYAIQLLATGFDPDQSANHDQ